ncbi:MAG: hypothetical protein Q8922_04055, partial [Bacteroidota bacterium]|nr:hypothetical protein [Bacteroidota bacterium]
MKYLVLLVAAWILACLVPISIYAQRSIGANSIVLDDGSGHTITLEVPPGLGSNYTYLLPPPPAGNAPAGFVVEGTSTGQTMYWNGATWVQSNFIANTNSAMGLGFVTIPPAFAFPITLNAAMGPATTSTLDLGDATHHFATLYVDNIIGTTGFADVWTRTGATVSPTTPGDNVTTSGNISTTGTGSLTSANGLTLTGTFGSNGSTGASGQVLMVNGAGNPVWTSPSALSTISFDNITSGLNTGAAMTLGAGASLLAGGGRIEATAFIGTGSTSDAIDLATTEVGGVLPIANGGTGIVSSGVSGNFLRSNGIAWVSSAIQASDIPNNNSNTSGSAGSFTGSLVGDVTGMQSATVVASVGGSTATSVHATVQTVSASTPNNIPFTLIERDGSGGFAAGDITGYAVSTHSLGVTTDLVVSGNTSLGGSIMTSLPAGVVHGGGFLDVGPVNLTSEVSNTLSVLHGGTGSANQAGARANLGAAASGVNNDITSLTGLTTPLAIAAGGTGATTASGALDNLLPSQAGNSGKVLQSNGTTASWQASSGSGTVTSVGISGGSTGLNTSGGPITAAGTITLGGTLAAANGGTGITASGASGNFLRSNGSSWASSAIQTGDLPANSSNYIQNQNGAPQTANFSITGTGTVGGSLTSNYEVISTFTGGGAIYGYGSIISGTSTNQGTFTLNDGAGVGAYHYASIAPGTLSASHTYLLPNIGLAGNTADFVIATDQGTTGQVLVSQGADAPAVWSSASGAFILNQNGSPQTANFNIAGTGTVGGSLTSNYEVISTFTGGGAIYGYGSIISGTSTNQGTFTLNDGAGVGAYHYASIAPGTLTASHTYLLPNIGLGGNTAQLVTAGDQGAQGQVLMSQGADAPATWLDGNGSFIANSTSTQAGAN